MKFGSTERLLNRRIDEVRARNELNKAVFVEVTDPIEINNKVAKARVIFRSFLFHRTQPRSKSTAGFSIAFDHMAETLELTGIPRDILQAKMDEIVLSEPSMAKTETGYMVSNLDLFYEKFRRRDINKEIIDFLSKNPDTSYSNKDIADKLSMNRASMIGFTKKLVLEGKIVVAGRIENHLNKGGKLAYLFKIAKQN